MELRAFGIEMEIRFRVLPNSFWDSIRFVTDRCHHSGNNAILVMNLKRSLDTRRTACLIVQQWLLELLAGGLSANPMRWFVSRRLFPGKTNYRFCNSFWHSLCFQPRRVFEPLGQLFFVEEYLKRCSQNDSSRSAIVGFVNVHRQLDWVGFC